MCAPIAEIANGLIRASVRLAQIAAMADSRRQGLSLGCRTLERKGLQGRESTGLQTARAGRGVIAGLNAEGGRYHTAQY